LKVDSIPQKALEDTARAAWQPLGINGREWNGI